MVVGDGVMSRRTSYRWKYHLSSLHSTKLGGRISPNESKLYGGD